MKCPMCSLPEEWHDDGDCPTYRQAAGYLFTPEPTDLRELVVDRKIYYAIRQVGKYWAIIFSYINDYGRRVNELLDVRKEKDDLVPILERYNGMGKVLHS